MASSYDKVKEFRGKRYTGMAVGRSHTWRYDAGDWKERKVTPDRWEFRYAVVKRRAGRAPEGSGAPVGTSHHWFLVADQIVTKLDANSYSTEMTGHKIKVAHRRAGHDAWNASGRTQQKTLIKQLRELADDLEAKLDAPEEPVAAPSISRDHRRAAGSSARHASRAPRPRARPRGPGVRASARVDARRSRHHR